MKKRYLGESKEGSNSDLNTSNFMSSQKSSFSNNSGMVNVTSEFLATILEDKQPKKPDGDDNLIGLQSTNAKTITKK